MGLDMEVDWKGKSTSVCVGLSGSRSDRGAPSQSHVVSCTRGFDHAMGGASHKYRLISGDIKTAFLSGDEDIRNIFISPPDDVRQMLNLDHETGLRLRKAGCADW